MDDFIEIRHKVSTISDTLKIENEERARVMRQTFDTELWNVVKDIEYLKKSNDYIQSGKANTKELDELRERFKKELEPKVDLHEVQTALSTC